MLVIKCYFSLCSLPPSVATTLLANYEVYKLYISVVQFTILIPIGQRNWGYLILTNVLKLKKLVSANLVNACKTLFY